MNRNEYQREWRRKNPDKAKEIYKRSNKKQFEKLNKWIYNWPKKLYNRAKINALRYNREFNIKLEDIIITEYCPILNIKLDMDHKWYKPSLDRIDNSKGYIKENIVVISYRANWLKSSATKEELKLLSDFYNKG